MDWQDITQAMLDREAYKVQSSTPQIAAHTAEHIAYKRLLEAPNHQPHELLDCGDNVAYQEDK